MTERAIYRQFEKPGKVLWLKHYKGRFDGMNSISVSLAYDGKDCKGMMTYLSSKEKFNLEGDINGNEINLEEKGKNGKVSAVIFGTIEGKQIEADWITVENNTGAKIFLEEVNREVKIPTRCGEDKWIRLYHGFFEKEKVELLLHHPDHIDYYGMAFFNDQKATYKINGERIEEGQIKLTLKDSRHQNKGKLNTTLDDQNTLKGKFQDEENHVVPISLALVQQLNMACLEHADFQSNVDISYPLSLNEKFNSWIEDFTKQWVAQSQKQINELKPQYKKKKPDHRALFRAFAWCELSMVNERLITGYFSSSYSWGGVQPGESFNFDLFAGKPITEKDIFKQDAAHEDFVKQYIKLHIRKLALYKKDKIFRAWLDKETFGNFVVQKDGIKYSTAFSPIYGRQEIVIPYKVLKDFLKENSAVSHLVD